MPRYLVGVWAATAWDDEDRGGEGARGWSVMGRLRERRQVLNAEAAAAVRRLTKQKHESLRMMTAASGEAAVYQEALRAATRSGPTVLAFLFAQPYSDAIHALDSSGEYFDQRSGEDWDLFFPGYYRAEDDDLEKRAGSRPVGTNFAKGWYFNTNDFSRLRKHVQDASKARWKYSGLTDLVLICAWLEQDEEVTIDWESTISGSVTDSQGPSTLTLNEIIERVSDDLESGAEDANFGVRKVTNPNAPRSDHPFGRELAAATLTGIGLRLGEKGLGL